MAFCHLELQSGSVLYMVTPHGSVSTLVHSEKHRVCVFIDVLIIVIRRNCLQQRLSDGTIVYNMEAYVFHMITSYVKQDIDLYRTCMHDYACMCAFENG